MQQNGGKLESPFLEDQRSIGFVRIVGLNYPLLKDYPKLKTLNFILKNKLQKRTFLERGQ